MKAILSCTFEDLYLFNLPFAIYSWNQLDVACNVFIPDALNSELDAQALRKLTVVYETIQQFPLKTFFNSFLAPPNKMATYAQCSRLFGGTLISMKSDEILVTSDADMCVFNKEYWSNPDFKKGIHIIGSDLVPAGQYPMCYAIMSAHDWWAIVSQIVRFSSSYSTVQSDLDLLLGDLEADNFRGNYWSKDQETLADRLNDYADGDPAVITKHTRAIPGTQFASRRADRDGWHNIKPDIIDAHLPRPGYTEENFERILHLFEVMYPDQERQWMIDYRKKYLQCI